MNKWGKNSVFSLQKSRDCRNSLNGIWITLHLGCCVKFEYKEKEYETECINEDSYVNINNK